jgi:tetratricopeptide (TPR) repeat protein
MHPRLSAFVLLLLVVPAVSCLADSTSAPAQRPTGTATTERKPETMSLLGAPLYQVQLAPDAKLAAEEKVRQAREALAKAPASADAMLWLGRQLAAAGQVREAVAVFTGGIAKFPADARFYRHRGHRYVTLRQFDKAIADLTKASQLIAGKADQQEPTTADPTVMSSETVDYAIYYHLGLAYYLKGDFARALPVYRQCLAVAKGAMGNDDQIAGSSDWLYMTLRRLGRTDEAAKVLEAIVPGMKVKDDQNYYDRLMMYKGVRTPQDVMATAKDPVSEATLAYGVANWHLYNGRKDEAKPIFQRIVTGSNWMPFGFIGAEAELARMK